MAAWHRSRGTDLGLHALGLGLIGLAYLAIARLVALHIPAQSTGPIALGPAAAGFVSGRAESTLSMLGKHLFDEIETGARWQHRVPDTTFEEPVEIERKP